MAMLDWVGKTLARPGLAAARPRDKAGALTTTYSIGIDEVPVMQEKVRDSRRFQRLQDQGRDQADDRKIIEGIRAVTSKPLRADANEGWKTKEEALEMIDWMAGMGVELVEQPMPADQARGLSPGSRTALQAPASSPTRASSCPPTCPASPPTSTASTSS